MNNQAYFSYSQANPEEILDPYYAKNKVVIPKDASIPNTLIINNEKMIEYITAFKVLKEMGKDLCDEAIKDIVHNIVIILDTTENINYSAFAQFFMVYNSTYSIFKNLKNGQKEILVYEMLVKYCDERHSMYLSHGYSNIVLQVLCDNYSHKRNSKTGIEKILDIMKPYGLYKIEDINELDVSDNFYFLPDKGGKKIFEHFLLHYNLKMESRTIEQNKLPDIVFKHNGHFYIFELKTMKEGGGGQNKQVVEFAYFIKFSEQSSNFHYITFLDSLYSNELFYGQSPKTTAQRNDVISALNNNPNNYFLNTKGFMKFVEDIFSN